MNELKRILYVEDDPAILELIGLALITVGGLEAKGCASGEEAVSAAPGFAPQLVLLDVMMPGMDGPMTLQELRKIDGLEAIPFVFLTAKFNTAETERLREMGAADVLAKPFDPMSLAQTLKTIHEKVMGG
ncbi:MAG: response regulator [Roseovarius sp.]